MDRTADWHAREAERLLADAWGDVDAMRAVGHALLSLRDDDPARTGRRAGGGDRRRTVSEALSDCGITLGDDQTDAEDGPGPQSPPPGDVTYRTVDHDFRPGHTLVATIRRRYDDLWTWLCSCDVTGRVWMPTRLAAENDHGHHHATVT